MASSSCRNRVPRFFWSFRFRMMLLVLLTLLPAFGLVIRSASEQRRLAAMQAQENALRIARSAAGRLEQFIQAKHEFLSILVQLPAVRDRDSATCSGSLERVVRKDPWFVGMNVVEPSGIIVCGAGMAPIGLDFSKNPAVRQGFDSQQFSVSDYRIGPLSGKGLVTFGQPVVDETGQVRAVLICTYDVNVLNDVAAQSLLPPGSALTVIDRNGTIMARYPDPGDWLGRPVPEAPIEEAIRNRQGEGAVEAVGGEGLARLFAYTTVRGVPNLDMFVSVGIPTSIAFADANGSLRRNLIALVLVAVLALTMAWAGGDVLYARKMGALLRATSRLTAGDLSGRTGLAQGVDELSQLASAFDKMAEALAKREAERGDEAQARALLLQQVISAQEDERKRIARELHDETSQGLSVLLVALETINMELVGGGREASRLLQDARKVAASVFDGIRRLIGDLRPSLLDDLGLVPAIAWYASQRLEPLGINADLQCDLPDGIRLPPATETALFRIAQEAIGNVARHASASQVRINLRIAGDRAVLTVEDNGCGFESTPDSAEPSPSGRGLGLQGIRERVRILGGQFTLRTALGQGTRLEVDVPYAPGEVANGQNAHSLG